MIVSYHGPDATWRGGWRRCIVYHKGYKHARLLDIGSLETYKIPARELEHARPCSTNPHKLAARLRERARQRERLTPGFRTGPVRKAIDALLGKYHKPKQLALI